MMVVIRGGCFRCSVNRESEIAQFFFSFSTAGWSRESTAGWMAGCPSVAAVGKLTLIWALAHSCVCVCALCTTAYFWYQSLPPPPPPPQSHGSAEEIENEITIIRGAKAARLVSLLAGWLEVVLVLVVQAAELNYCTNDRSRNNAATVCLSVSLSFGCCFVRHNKDTDDDDDNLFNCVTILLTSFFLLLLACCCCCTSDVITAMIMSSGGCRGGSGQEAFSAQEEVQCFN